MSDRQRTIAVVVSIFVHQMVDISLSFVDGPKTWFVGCPEAGGRHHLIPPYGRREVLPRHPEAHGIPF